MEGRAKEGIDMDAWEGGAESVPIE